MDDERVDALVQAVGIPEVPVKDMREKRQVLRDDRAIEPVHPSKAAISPGLARGPRMAAREAAGDYVLEQEHEHGQAEQDDHGLAEGGAACIRSFAVLASIPNRPLGSTLGEVPLLRADEPVGRSGRSREGSPELLPGCPGLAARSWQLETDLVL